MIFSSWDFFSQIMFQGGLLGSTSVKAWYLIPLIVVVSLVYGGTRHESLTEILAHSLRSALWLVVFLFAIFALVWLSGFGTAADLLNPWDSQLIVAAMAWTFGAMWIAGGVFHVNTMAGLGCVLSGGILALVIGLRSCNLLPFTKRDDRDAESLNEPGKELPKQAAMWFPVILMIAALGWALIALWMRG